MDSFLPNDQVSTKTGQGQFVREEDLGDIRPDQCEVTYVNHIPVGTGWNRPGQINKVFTVWSGGYSDRYLGEPEDVEFKVRYRLKDDDGKSYGRLYVAAESRFKLGDGSRLMRLSLTARGAPIGKGLRGALRFMDDGREQIVRGFTSITRSRMHEIWEREQ